MVAQGRTVAEFGDEVAHDRSQVATVLVGDPQLSLVARAAGEDRLDSGELLRALELDRDLGEIVEDLAKMLAHGHKRSLTVDDDVGVKAVPGRTPLVLPDEPGLDPGQVFPVVQSPTSQS